MSDPSAARPLRWQAVLLVCKDCVDRGSGPKKSGAAKALMPALRQATRRGPVRTRVFPTGCLGLCPKRATAVARLGQGEPARIVAIRSRNTVAEGLVALVGPSASSPVAAVPPSTTDVLDSDPVVD